MISSPVGTTTAEVVVSGTDSPSSITVYQPSGVSTVVIPNLGEGTKHKVTAFWKGPSGVTSQTTTVTTLPSTTAAVPGPVPTVTNLYPLNATAVKGNADSGGPGCSSGLATAVLSGSSLTSPIDSDFVFLLSGLQPEKTYTITASFDCNGTTVTSTPSSVTMPSKTPAPPAPVPVVVTPPAAVEVSNVQSCYPTVSVTTVDADPNTLLEVGILCLDQTGGGNDFLSETFVPVDAANTKNGQFVTVVSIGHVPVGEKCSVQANHGHGCCSRRWEGLSPDRDGRVEQDAEGVGALLDFDFGRTNVCPLQHSHTQFLLLPLRTRQLDENAFLIPRRICLDLRVGAGISAWIFG